MLPFFGKESFISLGLQFRIPRIYFFTFLLFLCFKFFRGCLKVVLIIIIIEKYTIRFVHFIIIKVKWRMRWVGHTSVTLPNFDVTVIFGTTWRSAETRKENWSQQIKMAIDWQYAYITYSQNWIIKYNNNDEQLNEELDTISTTTTTCVLFREQAS